MKKSSINTLQMIVCSGEFTKMQTGKELACYAGVVPFEHSSGTSVRARPRIWHCANKKMKKYLHLAGIQGEGELQAYYQRQLANGKDKMSVLNAVSGKKAMLPPPPPLRTQRASFPALPSSTPQPQLIRLQPVAAQQPLPYSMGALWSPLSFDSGVHQR